MNYLICSESLGEKQAIQKNLQNLWGMPVETITSCAHNIYFTHSKTFDAGETELFLLDGFVWDYRTGRELDNFKKDILNCSWPLSDDFTGMFSIVYISSDQTIIANDLLGILPLYYFQRPGKNELLVTNSFLSLSAFRFSELDPVGVYQRRYSNRKITFGDRTIIKDLKRLMPGELIKFNENRIVLRKFDNTLYNNISTEDTNLKDIARKYYTFLTNEYEIGLRDYDHVTVGLSGGADSRLMLSCLPEDLRKELVTYGTYGDEIEVKIAKRIASICPNSSFVFTDIGNSHFPPEEDVNEIIKETEAYYVNHWIPLFKMKKTSKVDGNILIGDMCEAVPGKFISVSLDKKNKVKNTFSNVTYNQSTNENFNTWSSTTLFEEIKVMKIPRLDSFLDNDIADILSASVQDITLVLERVKAHNPPYVELFSELFEWFTYIRMLHAKQYLIHKNRIGIVNPTLFFNNLRTISNIHPRHRVNYRLMDAIFKNFNKAKRLGNIPVAQSPFVPYNFPRIIRLLLWGFRAKADRYLIKRKVKNHSLQMRYRLFKSLDWPLIYNQKDALPNLSNLVQEDYVNAKEVIDIFQKRHSLMSWPLASTDITLIISINQEIKIFQKQKSLIMAAY